jgi:hypothetical protein
MGISSVSKYLMQQGHKGFRPLLLRTTRPVRHLSSPAWPGCFWGTGIYAGPASIAESPEPFSPAAI